ncbi:Curlin associated repeat-containing protein [Salegentibacter salinarum]|nr:hypothetical protein [Salegentibacter salinarum]SKB42288.1 Curlin associated repeat-containing protein [Salegentibacter salinarum]
MEISLSLTQVGDRNYSQVVQGVKLNVGPYNDHTSNVEQIGDDNRSFIKQWGENNRSSVVQTGDDNDSKTFSAVW